MLSLLLSFSRLSPFPSWSIYLAVSFSLSSSFSFYFSLLMYCSLSILRYITLYLVLASHSCSCSWSRFLALWIALPFFIPVSFSCFFSPSLLLSLSLSSSFLLLLRFSLFLPFQSPFPTLLSACFLHISKLGIKCDVPSRRGGMWQAGPHRPKSEEWQCRVQNISIMFNAGLFSSDAHCGHECENNDIEHGHVKAQDSSRNEKRSRTLAVCSMCYVHWSGANFVQQKIALKRMPHTTHDGHHHN